MIKKTKLTNYPIINEFLEQVGGEKASELVKFYEKKGKPIKDEDAAGKMKVKVTDVEQVGEAKVEEGRIGDLSKLSDDDLENVAGGSACGWTAAGAGVVSAGAGTVAAVAAL